MMTPWLQQWLLIRQFPPAGWQKAQPAPPPLTNKSGAQSLALKLKITPMTVILLNAHKIYLHIFVTFLVFYIKIRPKCTVALIWFHSFFSRKKSEIWIAFTFFEKWKVKSFSFSLFSRNEKWIDFWFHSFQEVKVKLKSLEIERWNMKKILENSRETRLSQGTDYLNHAVYPFYLEGLIKPSSKS